MRLKNFLIVVKDVEAAKKFYKEILGLDVIVDFGQNVILTGGLVLQEMNSWKQLTGKEVTKKSNSFELYFETHNMEHFLNKLEKSNYEIEYVSPLTERDWGQQVLRLYDLDGHILEVAETEESVARRYLNMGMDKADVAEQMRLPLDYIEEIEKKITIAN